MNEHMFAPAGDPRARDAIATSRAAERGERLLDELTRPGHDWVVIRALALQLLGVADAMAGPPPGRTIPSSRVRPRVAPAPPRRPRSR